jgi:hypothetical protein
MIAKSIDLAAMVRAGDVSEEFAEERRGNLIIELAGLAAQINDLKSILEIEKPRLPTNHH